MLPLNLEVSLWPQCSHSSASIKGSGFDQTSVQYEGSQVILDSEANKWTRNRHGGSGSAEGSLIRDQQLGLGGDMLQFM